MAIAPHAIVEVDAALVREAEALGVDIRGSIATALARAIADRKRAEAWEHENAGAIATFNDYIDRYGTAGESERRYG